MESKQAAPTHTNAKDTPSENARLLQVLDELMASPDDRGSAFWDEFDRDLRENRVNLRLFGR